MTQPKYVLHFIKRKMYFDLYQWHRGSSVERPGIHYPKVTPMKFKAPAKLYRIGEIVCCTPFTRQTIHNYTIMGLIQEIQWTQGGHRLYDESVFEQLSRIQQLRQTRTLSQIRKLFATERAAEGN